MDVLTHLHRIADRIEQTDPASRADELAHLLRQYEYLRASGQPLLHSFATVATAPSNKRKLIARKHDEQHQREKLAKRRRTSRAWRTLERYSHELLHLHRTAGLGSRALEKWLWTEHRKKVSYRTIARWLANKEKERS